ncbi:cbb3-type cytochrome oxidase assembly protein CcoS [Parvibaculum sp.]|uniref:cbb3-type cytochrome oxidase assembly protein CcoS n=1 Tax=Parvibaculum sp. TaxID=2024848 RepID=UPI001D6F5240|nr:cbb3-type cytochrome oxidase assembly protein CcoS [Parvibaculum sp.]MBX3488690.1 cbb3-type cytochrome oxidase assembly protein CcoS [Parvibaculum sp.]MCW5727428.1 cbb3-type cytochrome oxidase assembly protein CcoS [Parvibaculum sp.]
MIVLVWLVPIALAMGFVALCAFLWSIGSDQYDDLDGAAERVLLHQQEDYPLLDKVTHTPTGKERDLDDTQRVREMI